MKSEGMMRCFNLSMIVKPYIVNQSGFLHVIHFRLLICLVGKEKVKEVMLRALRANKSWEQLPSFISEAGLTLLLIRVLVQRCT